jgi:ParB-like chromosome segregation protein Spo0J
METSDLTASESKAGIKPTALPIREIHVDRDMFQWRVPKYNRVESEEHLRTLVRALKSTSEPLDPLLVFPMNGRFFVIDGHHRLDAYRKARWKGPIPVEVFEGTFDEARLAALTGNTKDKLRLSRPEKAEAAWRLVNEGKLSKSQIVKLGLASDGTVSSMRRVRKKLMDEGEDLTKVSWAVARWGVRATVDDPEDWKEKKAQKIVDALLKAKIGQGLAKDPEVTALALQMLNPGLPLALVWQWWSDDPDLKSEIVEELRKEEDVYELLDGPEEPEPMPEF